MISIHDSVHYNCIPIHRACPACRVWGRHDTKPLLNVARLAYQATCAKCDHTWPCRITAGDRLAHQKIMEKKSSTRAASIRSWSCADCSETSDAPMLIDELWLSIANREDMLCFTCTEKRLDRPIRVSDLNDSLMSRTFRRLLSNELTPLPELSLCEECWINYADPPSRLCPGCEAYREHQR